MINLYSKYCPMCKSKLAIVSIDSDDYAFHEFKCKSCLKILAYELTLHKKELVTETLQSEKYSYKIIDGIFRLRANNAFLPIVKFRLTKPFFYSDELIQNMLTLM